MGRMVELPSCSYVPKIRMIKRREMIGQYIWLTPGARVLLEKLIGPDVIKEFLIFEWTCGFILALCPNPQSDLNISFNIILPSATRLFKWYLYLAFPHRKPLYTSSLLRTCYMPRLSRSWFDHRVIWRGIQIIKFLVMWSSPPCYLVFF